MIRVRLLAVFLSFFLCTGTGFAMEDKITLTTLNWEPYIGENLKNQGYVAEIVREALKRRGYGVEFKFMPWARAVYVAQKGGADGYFPEYYSESLNKHFHFSDPIPGGPIGFFKLKSKRIDYKILPDLKPYTIGVVRSYVNTAEFDAAEYLDKDEAVDDLTNFKKLLKGRVDLVIGDQFVGCHIIEQQLKKSQHEIEFMHPPLEIKKLFVCFSKKNKRAAKILGEFNHGLRELEQDGTIDNIIAKHGFPPSRNAGPWITPCR